MCLKRKLLGSPLYPSGCNCNLTKDSAEEHPSESRSWVPVSSLPLTVGQTTPFFLPPPPPVPQLCRSRAGHREPFQGYFQGSVPTGTASGSAGPKEKGLGATNAPTSPTPRPASRLGPRPSPFPQHPLPGTGLGN